MFINISNNNDKPVWVNINKIHTVESNRDNDTVIYLDNLNYSYSDYSVEEIMQMIERKLS